MLFYGHSSRYPGPDKGSPGHPQGTEREGERRQAVLSREQAGDPSRPASPGVEGGAASPQCEGGVRGLRAQITKGMRDNSRWGDPLSPFVWDWGAFKGCETFIVKIGKVWVVETVNIVT